MSQLTESLLGHGRQRELLNYIRSYGSGSVTEFAKLLGVSASTVRRDLAALQERGLIERVHGGAAHLTDIEPLRPLREVAYAEEKTRIGRAAARKVQQHSTILVTGGTTTDAMLPHLTGIPGLTVLTNNLSVANRLVQASDLAVIVLGGLLRRQELSLLGHLTVSALNEFNIDQVYTGAFGVDARAGLTGTNLSETQVDRSLVNAAAELVVLADHSKLTQRGPIQLAPLAKITRLIIDDGAAAADLAELRAGGVTVDVC